MATPKTLWFVQWKGNSPNSVWVEYGIYTSVKEAVLAVEHAKQWSSTGRMVKYVRSKD